MLRIKAKNSKNLSKHLIDDKSKDYFKKIFSNCPWRSTGWKKFSQGRVAITNDESAFLFCNPETKDFVIKIIKQNEIVKVFSNKQALL
jgi:hypothetical protein